MNSVTQAPQTCAYCGKQYFGHVACPHCTARVMRRHNRHALLLMKSLVLIPLLVAAAGLIYNLLFLANTTQTTGEVVGLGIDSGINARAHRGGGLRYTATVEYRLPLGRIGKIEVRPFVLDIQFFEQGERVPVRYSPDDSYAATPTTFWYFWSNVWVPILIAAVYGMLLALARHFTVRQTPRRS